MLIVTGSMPKVNLEGSPMTSFIMNFGLTILKPFRFLITLFSKKNLARIVAQVVNPNETDELKAISAACGVFIGIIPIWGFQTLAAIFVAMLLKLNKPLVIIFSQVSFPAVFPFIVYWSYQAGQYWVGGKFTAKGIKPGLSLQNMSLHLEQYVYGSISLAMAAALSVGILAFASLKIGRATKKYNAPPQKDLYGSSTPVFAND